MAIFAWLLWAIFAVIKLAAWLAFSFLFGLWWWQGSLLYMPSFQVSFSVLYSLAQHQIARTRSIIKVCDHSSCTGPKRSEAELAIQSPGLEITG